MVRTIARLLFGITHAILARAPGRRRCTACGAALLTIRRSVMREPLVSEWRLDPTWAAYFDQREGEMCVACGASLRARQLAAALLHRLEIQTGITGSDVRSLMASAAARPLRIAEINSCGALHKALARKPDLLYSEFQPDDKSLRHEDLLSLSYADDSLDVVLHSDTIEHAPDFDKAMQEIRRVLKPGGSTVFSTPVVRDGRNTVVRARVDDGKVINVLPPSFHGGHTNRQDFLVFYEFGEDIVPRIEQAGFDVVLFEHPDNPAAVTCIACKQ